MAEFKINGRTTVRKLKENFKNEFEGTLRVYNGKQKADDNATLAAIRNKDAKGGELICRASRTVGKFEQEMYEVFGIRVQVASPDDWVLALDGITLANLKKIKKNATKADMEELVAYKRKNTESKNIEVEDGNSEEKIQISYKFEPLPVFDFKFKKIDWELNEENIETHRETIDSFGVIYVRAQTEDGDFKTKVISNCDIADGLYDAIDETENLKDEEDWDEIDIYYTTVCEAYGADKTYNHGDDFGHVLASFLGDDDSDYDYSIDGPVICRAIMDNAPEIWLTDDWGYHDTPIELNVDALIEYKKDPESVAKKIEWAKPKMQCLNTKNDLLFEVTANFVNDIKSPNGLIQVIFDDKLGFINEKGEEIIPCKYDRISDFASNGLAAVNVDRKYGYINEKGEEIIPCKYNSASDFASNGLAAVRAFGKYGYINEKGEEIIPCKYDDANDFASNGLAAVEVNGKYGYINEKGEEIIPCKYNRANNFASNGLAEVKVDGKYGYINEKGEEIIPCKYDDVREFASNGLVAVEVNEKYGYFNEKGEEIIPCKYDYARTFASNGLAEVKVDGKYGYINEKGEEIIPCKYDYTYDFASNGLAAVEVDGKYGYINEKGEEIIPCKYDSAKKFASNGLAAVRVSGKYGYINEKGEEIIPCKYDDANNFASNGLAEVKVDGKYGYINEKGEEIIPCKYDYTNDFASNGLAKVKVDEKSGCVNEKGEEIIPCKYDDLTIIYSKGLIFVKK